MILQRMTLQNFRNFPNKIFDFDEHLTMIVGKNARGKTNLLEAVYFLLNGVGFRETREEELISIGEKGSQVNGKLIQEKEEIISTIFLQLQENYVVKQYLVNRTKQSHQRYLAEQTKAILFAPQQLEIVTGSPNLRREYLNRQISFYDFEYRKRVVNFENALRKRNKVLEFHFNRPTLNDEIQFWDGYLEEQAKYITQKRGEYINFLNKHPKLDHKLFRVEYLKSEVTKEKLFIARELEIKMRRTSIGPQKDDFIIIQNHGDNKNVQIYGSRSEQRLALFWLKYNEIRYFEETQKKRPLILLDDIFSELDGHNRKMVVDLIEKYQTILTTTEEELPKLRVNGGVIKI